MMRGVAVYVALWTGHKLYIALGCIKFISLTFKSQFLTAYKTYSSTKFKQLILQGKELLLSMKIVGLKTNFVCEMKSFFVLKNVVVEAFLYTTYKLRKSVIEGYCE